MNVKRIYIILTVCISLLFCACSKDDLFDFVVGPQPHFLDDHQFIAGLNILGVIRPDSFDGKSLSTIQIEKVVPAVSKIDDSTTVIDYNFVIYKIINQTIIDSLCFVYKYPDTTYIHQPTDFNPFPGNHYRIVCQSPGLPILTAETVIPNQPVIVNGSMNIKQNNIQFAINNDTSAFLYDIYIFVGDQQYNKRLIRSKIGNTIVDISGNIPQKTAINLSIYAYDKHLSEYLTVTNLFIKPNTFRPPFSTVHNGYGCFGSLNVLTLNF